ncbi:hypothetical protein [Arthrobacter sp. ISL-30]|uniref:hypothetical protein n=1 Tax=Arthrobacter sp. ISL-30 TaxID=2819109 RepID=UPI001BEC8FAA|nr:hypothetical protein [Arthrobacter sp. ISL-30]MBT2513433.1 hypothetical protein [Arthrobacter sp. ISL-30]
MDPIKNQISAIDPLKAEPQVMVDGEEALHRMLTGPVVFTDGPTAGVTPLEDRRRRRFRIAGALALGAAAVTGGILVASNFGQVSSTPAPATTVTSTQTVPSATATQTAPSATPTQTVPSETPSAAAVVQQTFAFPDGHISFKYPEGWTVRIEQGPYLNEQDKAGAVIAVVSDSSGAEVARIFSGMYGDGAAGRVKRTVLDHAPVSGITEAAGNPVEFGFASDQILPVTYEGMPAPTETADGPVYYFMDVRRASEFQSGETSSGSNQIPLPNGIMSAYVVFDFEKQPAFATPDAAREWMATEQYAQLKALLLSLNYQ